jgi:hypothetical protein
MPPIDNKETAIRFFKEIFENKLNQFIELHPSEDIVDLGKMAESIIRRLVSNVLGEIDKIKFADLLKVAPIISNFDVVIYWYKNSFNLHDKGLVLTSFNYLE